MPESKDCAECGATFTRKPHRSHAQWANQTCCTTACANAIRARGGPRNPGELTKLDFVDKTAAHREYQRRQAMPRWATWWEDVRRVEDQADFGRTLIGGPTCRLSGAPTPRKFTAGICRDCGCHYVVHKRKWNDCPRCSRCTKARWRETHYKRAARYGARFDVIQPQRIFERDGWRCQICGRKTSGKWPNPKSPSLDHIVPMARGGDHVFENLQCACLACNVRKGARSANDQLRLAV